MGGGSQFSGGTTVSGESGVVGLPDFAWEIMWLRRRKSVDTPRMGSDKGGVDERLGIGVAMDPSGTLAEGARRDPEAPWFAGKAVGERRGPG
jgi:hypothetical protein